MSKHHCIYILFYAVINSCFASQLVPQTTQGNEAKFELCSTVNNKPGSCVPVKQCEALFNLLKLRPISDKNVNYLRKSQCGFVGLEPKVCCALDNEDNPSFPMVQIPSTVQTVPKPGNVLPGLDECGMFVDDRLIYWKGTQLGSFPWLALLEYQKPEGKGVHCGGVLISSRYILTAAHCVSWKNIPGNWNLISVRLGEHNTTTDPDCIEVLAYTDCSTHIISIPVEAKIIHEDYDPTDVNQYHNIALLRLAEPISYSEFVSPICLPPAHDEGLGMLPFAIAGWGANKQFEGFDVKRDATLSAKTKADCEAAYAQLRIRLREDQLCAARTSDSNDTCNGDSGGALMSANPQYSLLGNYFAIGVMSIGPKDCASTQPTIYTKVRNYLEWMKRKMKP